MLSSGGRQGREYGKVMLLENYWRDHTKRFESFALNVADRRAQSAADVELPSFSSCLQSSLDGTEWQEKYSAALQVVTNRTTQLADGSTRFQDWIAALHRQEG